jgi:hypothetical protein
VNKRHDFAKLEREFITSQVSLRELCRRHGITAHSLVTAQAKKGQWAEKRAAHQARSGKVFIEKHAHRLADRQAQISDKALDAIDQALEKFRADMRATEKKLVNGEWVEVPVMRLKPNDVAILIDRLMVLFEKPSTISQHQGLTVTSEVSVESLRDLIEATRGRAGSPRMEESPLPRRRRLDD